MKVAAAMRRQSVLERVTPDDELVGHGVFHMERMDENHIWFQFAGHAFDLIAVNGPHGPELQWIPQAWPDASTD